MRQINSIRTAPKRLSLMMASLSLTCVSASAIPPDVFNPYVSYAQTYDSNLLDLPNSAAATQLLGSPGMSDVMRTGQVGIAIDDLIGLQHITADLNESKTQFNRLRNLDYQAPNARANWNWDIIENLSGNLGYSYSKSLASFLYFHLPEKNLYTLKLGNFDVAWKFHPSWRAVASFDSVELGFDLPSQQVYGRNEYHTVAGIDYLSADTSSIGLQAGTLRTYFPRPQLFGSELIANNSTQDEIKLKVDWVYSDKTRLRFLGGWVDRKYEILSNQNYRGWNERLTVDWAATSQVLLKVNAYSEIGAVDGLTTVYATNRGLDFAPAWIATEKIRFDGDFKLEKHQFAQTTEATATITPGNSYFSRSQNLQLTYMPTPAWHLTAAASHRSQSSSENINNFSGYAINLGVRFEF